MMKRAVVLIDLQNEYFASGKSPLAGIDAAAANAAKVLEKARTAGDTIIHIRHEFAGPNPPMFAPGSEGAEINAAVRPADGEPIIVKNYPNSFRDTALKETLDRQGVKEVVLVGAMSHMCIAATGRAAAELGFKTLVVHDACATRDLTFNDITVPAALVHAANMSALEYAYARVVGTKDFLGVA